MLNFLLGVVITAAVYTFFPTLALKPSEWLRRAVAWLRFKA